MNKVPPPNLDDLADALSLRLQELRVEGILKETEPFLDLDYASQAKAAPFVFDMALATVHRNRCAAIPASSKSTLYAVWEWSVVDEPMACPICCPHLAPAPPPAQSGETIDLILGIISFLDQFSSVLRERGKEYRESNKGNAAVAYLEQLLASPGAEAEKTSNSSAGRSEELGATPNTTDGTRALPKPTASFRLRL